MAGNRPALPLCDHRSAAVGLGISIGYEPSDIPLPIATRSIAEEGAGGVVLDQANGEGGAPARKTSRTPELSAGGQRGAGPDDGRRVRFGTTLRCAGVLPLRAEPAIHRITGTTGAAGRVPYAGSGWDRDGGD